jgi:hypothetical protein
VITLYVEALGNAIQAAHGALSYVELDSICALFGLECDTTQAAQQALQAAGAIESAMSDLNERLGRQWDCKMKIAVSVHAGRAAVGEIGSSDSPGDDGDRRSHRRGQRAAQGRDCPRSVVRDFRAGLHSGRPRAELREKNHGAIPRPRDAHSCLSVRIGGGIGASRAHCVAFANAEISAQAAGVIGRRSVVAGRRRKQGGNAAVHMSPSIAYVRNTSTATCMTPWMALTPPELVDAHLN